MARFASLATRSFAASRFEREIHDLFGLVPEGHPDLRRLALHQYWPDGYHPLRRDVVPRTDFVDAGEPFPFRHVEGEGIFEITVGPVHAGIIEPGHFRFSVEGETIVNLETRLGFVHKGTEKLFEGLAFDQAPALAERISGDTSVGHVLAYCQALETLAGCTVPLRAHRLRVVLLELERIYNHVGDVGMIVNDTGFSFGHSHCFRIREELLRLNERLTGHRLLRGAVVPGGVTGPIATASLAQAAARIDDLVAEFAAVLRLCLDNTTVLERLQGTGRLTSQTATEMQVVGLVGRASGIDADVRRDAPFAAYGENGVHVSVYGTGDVWARTMVRLDEAREAARLIREVTARDADGVAAAPIPPLTAGAHAFGLVEAWRGPDLALGGGRRPHDARPREGRRSVLPQLARARIRGAEEHRPGLSPLQQVLQPLLFRERPVGARRATAGARREAAHVGHLGSALGFDHEAGRLPPRARCHDSGGSHRWPTSRAAARGPGTPPSTRGESGRARACAIDRRAAARA